MSNLDARRYQPRGNTPLLDAVGAMIARIDGEIVARADRALPIEDQVVVIITDGHENASREFSGQMISDLIAARKRRAWTFVFLGADETGLRDEIAMGVSARSTSHWRASHEGTHAMFNQLSTEMSHHRTLDSRQRMDESEHFFEEDESSESN